MPLGSGLPCLGINRFGYGADCRATRQKPDSLGPIVVSPPQRKPVRRADPGTQRSPGAGARLRVVLVRRPRCGSSCRPTGGDANSAQHQRRNRSRLSAWSDRAPDTGDSRGHRQANYRGSRSQDDHRRCQAAIGVIGGDAPGAPAIFSMRGFAGDQINTLYNDIWIGPSTMTAARWTRPTLSGSRY